MTHLHIPLCFNFTLYVCVCGNFHIMNINVPAVLVLHHSTHMQIEQRGGALVYKVQSTNTQMGRHT